MFVYSEIYAEQYQPTTYRAITFGFLFVTPTAVLCGLDDTSVGGAAPLSTSPLLSNAILLLQILDYIILSHKLLMSLSIYPQSTHWKHLPAKVCTITRPSKTATKTLSFYFGVECA